jgi:hypothetical protein
VTGGELVAHRLRGLRWGVTGYVMTGRATKTMPSRTQTLIDKIAALPAEGVAKVEDFVEFLPAKTQRQAALERLLEIAPALEAAGAGAISEADIQAEVAAVRGTKRAGDDHVIAACLAAEADLLVSGDRHLLKVAQHRSTRVVTPAEALRLITAA